MWGVLDAGTFYIVQVWKEHAPDPRRSLRIPAAAPQR